MDPVAAKSSFLCMYMSNHKDTLASYVIYYGKVKDAKITNAEMTGIDSKGMNISYKTPSSGAGNIPIRIEFEPPLSGYQDVKPRLLSMKAHAEEALGMVPVPQITEFTVTSGAWLLTGALIALLTYVTLSPPLSSIVPSYLYPGSFIRDIVGDGVVKLAWGVVVVAHTAESFYTAILVKRHRTPFGVGAMYILGTLLFGFPAWIELKRNVQAARIDSILKGK
ncbi:hypothetical protein BJ322DRAFT_598243 [Thelephora terrestris]|uniref:DUF2470 domain-containing protein n=1 Tax=Thelephora terrestris TaxID=56493 RepID=A0A9P6L915_9AGAM|nr:hypothetical protein BJ322DRAFT_598243 [Thelephora terrestris]